MGGSGGGGGKGTGSSGAAEKGGCTGNIGGASTGTGTGVGNSGGSMKAPGGEANETMQRRREPKTIGNPMDPPIKPTRLRSSGDMTYGKYTSAESKRSWAWIMRADPHRVSRDECVRQ
ncbi:hypothetical protein Scep_023039 [Stephania cephalantha]|uniref:Uncharacterized protein n=1 Tax=Stephania cephalantha TaxID=152367 RepID=A0AAP0F6K3_9MAGN